MPLVKEILSDFGYMKLNELEKVDALQVDGKWDTILR